MILVGLVGWLVACAPSLDGTRLTAGVGQDPLDHVDRRLTLQEARITALATPDARARLEPVDQERLEILVQALEAVRADLDALERSELTAEAWLAATRSIASRLDAIDRGLARLPVTTP